MTMFTTNSAPDNYGLSSEEKHIQNFAKHMLQGQIFMGIYQEKRYVEKLNSYRDIILINNAEKDLIHDLNIVFKRISEYYTTEWLGITTPDIIGSPAGYTLWVNLEEEVFGCYWYKIKGIKFKKDEIFLRLKKVRPVAPATEIRNEDISISESAFTYNPIIDEVKEIMYEKLKDVYQKAYALLTIHNIKETVIFVSIFVIAVFTGLLHAIQFLLEFSLKLFREMSVFTNSATPIAIACIKMCEKIIGGFYILLAMLWRDAVGPRNQQNHMEPHEFQSIQYRNNRRTSSYGRYEREMDD